jgi:hypothetical protein
MAPFGAGEFGAVRQSSARAIFVSTPTPTLDTRTVATSAIDPIGVAICPDMIASPRGNIPQDSIAIRLFMPVGATNGTYWHAVKRNRYSHRNATLIPVAFPRGLWVNELRELERSRIGAQGLLERALRSGRCGRILSLVWASKPVYNVPIISLTLWHAY